MSRSRRRRGVPPTVRIDLQKRRRFILDLLSQRPGITYQEIADLVIEQGMAPKPYKGGPGPEPPPRYRRQDAWADAEKAIADITEAPARQRKAIIARQLQQSARVLMRDAMSAGTPLDRARAIQVLIQLTRRQAKLFGLDEPVRTELEITAHLDQLGALSAQAISAGADAAGLSSDQRAALIAGMQGFLLNVEGGESDRPAALPPGGDVINVEAYEEGA